MRAYKLLSGHQYYEVHDKERWWTAKRQDDGGWYILSERNIPVSPDKTLGRKIVAAVLALNSEIGTENSLSAKSYDSRLHNDCDGGQCVACYRDQENA